MSISDELKRLEELRIRGTLTDAEFQQAKQQVLSGQAASSPPASGPPASGRPAAGRSASAFGGVQSGPGIIMGIEEKTWCMLMHLSQLLVFSGLGIIAPIVMWVLSKDSSPLAAQHGARMMNWLLSSLVYGLVAGVLCLFMIGIPILMALGVLTIAFPIVATLKCSEGEIWSYPGTIKFFAEG